MIPDRPPSPTNPEPSPRRLFLREPGWRVGHKIGSEKEFCYMMAPGQEFYHRLLDGEVYVHHGDERLCLACAERRGLLAYEPRGLGRSSDATSSGLVIEYDPANEDPGNAIDLA